MVATSWGQTRVKFLFSLAKTSVMVLACHLLFGTIAFAGTVVSQHGPAILVMAPVNTYVVSTRCDIDIRFDLQGRAAVDLSTLRVTVVKLWEIDITERVRPFVSPEGITMTEVDLPRGEHTFRIAIADAEGRMSAKTMTVRVQ